MGIFNFGKKKKDDSLEFKSVLVDNTYFLSLPKSWVIFKSDRFRMHSEDKQLVFSATNHGMEVGLNDSFSIGELETQVLPLFTKFVNEGEYESHNDLEISNNSIYHSFKVDNEHQYYFYTYRTVRQTMRVRICFIIRQSGNYSAATANLIKKIGGSITHKIADINNS